MTDEEIDQLGEQLYAQLMSRMKKE